MHQELKPSSTAGSEDAIQRKLNSYVQQTGIRNRIRARQLITGHFQSCDRQYPYVLFRSNTLYLFTAEGLRAAETLFGMNSTDYLRFDGERITRLDPLYYLGPEDDNAATGGWAEDLSCNNNNNNGNNNNNNG